MWGKNPLMSAHIIWLTSNEAKVFKLAPEGVEAKHFHLHGMKHATEPYGKHSSGHHPESVGLYKDLTAYLKDSSELLIMGPGESKVHFKTYLEKHAHELASKILAIQTTDQITDGQILAQARAFFKHYDKFEDVVK
jgi:stalled ribosome rescue protein Dom34